MAWRAYHESPPGVSFDEAVQAHWDGGGVVINTPELFCLARRVVSTWYDEDLLNCRKVAIAELSDAWFVWCAAGELWRLSAWAEPLAWVLWQHRTDEIKRIPWAKAVCLLRSRKRL